MKSQSKNAVFLTVQYPQIPIQIDWLIGARSSSPVWVSHNSSIIMLTGMMLEGAFEHILRNAVRLKSGVGWHEFDQSKFEERVFADFEERIRRISGWKDYKKGFKTIFGKDLGSATNAPELMEAIDILFKLRGAVIAHGRSYNFLAANDVNPMIDEFEYKWESAVYEDIEKYQIKNGFPLVPHHRAGETGPEPLSWLMDELVDHLYESSLALLLELSLTGLTDIDLFFGLYGRSEPATTIINERLGEREYPAYSGLCS